MRKLTIAAGFLVLGAALIFSACGDDDEDVSGDEATPVSGAQTVEVVATDFAFAPTDISAQPGETLSITLKNDGNTEHSFTIDDLDADTEAEGGEEATAEVTAPDTNVEFYCRYHPDRMRGTIDVGAGGAGAPTSSGDSGGYTY